jgi:hypothetical protein
VDPQDYIGLVAGVCSIAISVISFLRARTAVAVQAALMAQRVQDLERDLETHRAELNGVKIGLEAGIGRVQDSLQGVVDLLNRLETTVAVLVDRDERGPPRHRPPRPRATKVGS